MLKGNTTANYLATGDCKITNPNGTPSTVQYSASGTVTIPLTPATPTGPTTVHLSAGETETVNGLEFKVNAITASQLNVTVTNTKTAQSQTASLTLNNPVMVLGYSMTVTSFQQVSYGTIGGQPSYVEQATMSYQ